MTEPKTWDAAEQFELLKEVLARRNADGRNSFNEADNEDPDEDHKAAEADQLYDLWKDEGVSSRYFV